MRKFLLFIPLVALLISCASGKKIDLTVPEADQSAIVEDYSENTPIDTISIVVDTLKDEFQENSDFLELKEIRNAILEKALSYSGVPYKWAGSDSRGFDCSGFTSYVFRAKNLDIPRTAREQQRLARPVPLEDLLPGDLIFFSNGNQVDHVGIVVSNSQEDIQMVHASKSLGISLAGAKTNTYWSPRIHSGGSFLADFIFNPIKEDVLVIEEPKVELVVLIEPVPFVENQQNQQNQQHSPKIKHAIGLKAATNGLGAELVTIISPRFQLRWGGTYLPPGIPVNNKLFDVKAENMFKTGSLSMLLSFQAANNFYLTGGAFYNVFKKSISGSPSEDLNFQTLTVDPEKVELLTITMKPGTIVSPYFGIGFGRVVSKNKIVSAAFEVGGMYQGIHLMGLNTHGALTPEENLEQQQLLQDAYRNFKILPTVSLQLTFRFNKHKQ